MFKKFILSAGALAVLAMPRIVNFLGVGGSQDDLNTWGRWMTQLGIVNFIALIFLLLGGWLFVDEIQRRKSANPYWLLHQIHRRKAIARLFSRLQWHDYEHFLTVQSTSLANFAEYKVYASDPDISENKAVRVCGFRLIGENWRPNALTIKAAWIESSTGSKAYCFMHGKEIPPEGVRIKEWGIVALTASFDSPCVLGNGLSGGMLVRHFLSGYPEFQLIVQTDKGEFIETFSRKEIDAVLYREIVGRWLY